MAAEALSTTVPAAAATAADTEDSENHTLKEIYIMVENCLFCKIINGDIPSKKAYEDERRYGESEFAG